MQRYNVDQNMINYHTCDSMIVYYHTYDVIRMSHLVRLYMRQANKRRKPGAFNFAFEVKFALIELT